MSPLCGEIVVKMIKDAFHVIWDNVCQLLPLPSMILSLLLSSVIITEKISFGNDVLPLVLKVLSTTTHFPFLFLHLYYKFGEYLQHSVNLNKTNVSKPDMTSLHLVTEIYYISIYRLANETYGQYLLDEESFENFTLLLEWFRNAISASSPSSIDDVSINRELIKEVMHRLLLDRSLSSHHPLLCLKSIRIKHAPTLLIDYVTLGVDDFLFKTKDIFTQSNFPQKKEESFCIADG
ncbi:hypothetical protein LSM04_004032 [Trypanosoma melophagium]|nr:hypothetical protein LSM04_004032 [Trypanosoma melophagium]